jgi:hypothetical protein
MGVYKHIGLSPEELTLQKNSEEYVITPGGYRLKSTITEVTLPANTNISNLKSKGNRKLTAFRKYANVSDEMQNATDDFAITQGYDPWLACAKWIDIGALATLFTAAWRVPAHPSIDNGQTLYIFPGIQNMQKIVQPVLMWRGYTWRIFSMCASGNMEPPSVSGSKIVDPGTPVSAFVQMLGKRGNLATYTCGFHGYEETHLKPVTTPILNEFCVTLEAHNVEDRNELPGGNYCAMENVTVSAYAPLPVRWRTKNPGPFGTHTDIVSAGPSSRITLHF